MENYKYITKKTHIFMIHGLGSYKLTFFPMQYYLLKYGYINLHAISYPVNSSEFQESLEFVNNKILEILPKEDDEIVVIGQSFGGLICNNLHKLGRNILKSICICSPLHGSRVVSYFDYYLPGFIKNMFNKKPYYYLRDKEKEEKPPHDFHTISFGLFNSDFDSCVYKSEMILDEKKHTHITWSSHMGGFLDIRLFRTIYDILEQRIELPIIEEKQKKKEKYSDL